MSENCELQFDSSPYYKLRNYTVHQLTDSGLNQYISKQSQIHNFISHKKNPDPIDKYNESTKDNLNSLEESQNFRSMTLNTRENLKSINSPHLNKGLKIKKPSSNKKIIRNFKNISSSKIINKEELTTMGNNYLATDLEKLSRNTFNKINQILMKNRTKVKFENSAIGFNPYKIPRVHEDELWFSKQKWEISQTKRLEKMLYDSLCLSNKNQTKSVEFKEKTKNILFNEKLKNSLNFPKITVKANKIPKLEVNKIKFNKFIGDKYNPFNYEVNKEKINTCSIKDSFRYKK